MLCACIFELAESRFLRSLFAVWHCSYCWARNSPWWISHPGKMPRSNWKSKFVQYDDNISNSHWTK